MNESLNQIANSETYQQVMVGIQGLMLMLGAIFTIFTKQRGQK